MLLVAFLTGGGGLTNGTTDCGGVVAVSAGGAIFTNGYHGYACHPTKYSMSSNASHSKIVPERKKPRRTNRISSKAAVV